MAAGADHAVNRFSANLSSLCTPSWRRRESPQRHGPEPDDAASDDVGRNVAVAPTDDLETVIRAMVKRRIHRVPVLDAGAVVGIVTQTDILRRLFRTLDTPMREGLA